MTIWDLKFAPGDLVYYVGDDRARRFYSLRVGVVLGLRPGQQNLEAYEVLWEGGFMRWTFVVNLRKW